jgi:hypothetical protein
MTQRQVRDKNKSQIVFDIHGGEDSFQTMTLRTIPNRPHLIKGRGESFSLRTDEIEGAQSRPRKAATHYFQLNTADIEGASPTPPYDPNKPAFPIMSVDDIEGAKPRIQRPLPHSQRQTNPLNPEYSLPSYEEPPPPVPPFLRDGFSNDDIPGTHSRSWQLPYGPRDNMRVADGPGSHPRKRVGKLMQSSVDRMNVRDINKDGIYKTTRVTDPLNPVYFYDGGPIAATDFGRAFPRPEPRNVPTFSLQTDDIAGATSDSSTQWYRRFKKPPPEKEEVEDAPATLLMLPSMEKQTAELENQEAIRKMRGEKRSFYENRHLRGARGTGDTLQGVLRQQRSNMNQERITLSPTWQ